jgi:hypothetical protein
MLYDVEVRADDGTYVDWANNLPYDEAMARLVEWEVEYQDDPVDVILIPHAI